MIPARIASFPGLALRHRPELFAELVNHPFGDEPVVSARFGSQNGWIVIDPERARDLLRRRDLQKGRTAASRSAVGGYAAHAGADFRRRRSEVIVALARAASDPTGMANRLHEAAGDTLPARSDRPATITRWMILDLTHADAADLPLGTIQSGIDAAERIAESAQAEGAPVPDDQDAKAALADTLRGCVTGRRAAFTDELRARGWSDDDLVDELIGLALAGWESTAAALTSALTVGLGPDPTKSEIDEVLRLYPPSWLITRTMTGGEEWGAAGALAVVSPWLTQRSRAWAQPERFLPDRAALDPRTPAPMPFGAGPRRCPADLYARTQLAVAVRAFGGTPARAGRPALLGHRSAALLPEDEQEPRP